MILNFPFLFIVTNANGCASVCSNALVGVAYNFKYSGSNTISSVTADLVVADINGCTSKSLTQLYNTKFSAKDDSKIVIPQQNTVPRFKSGNPGYIKGRPILVGKIVTDGNRRIIFLYSVSSSLILLKLKVLEIY
jgi:hypothetical protein